MPDLAAPNPSLGNSRTPVIPPANQRTRGLRRDTTDARAEQVAVALMGAGSGLALTRPADAVAAGQLLGDAFAAMLEPEPSGDDERVRTIGVY